MAGGIFEKEGPAAIIGGEKWLSKRPAKNCFLPVFLTGPMLHTIVLAFHGKCHLSAVTLFNQTTNRCNRRRSPILKAIPRPTNSVLTVLRRSTANLINAKHTLKRRFLTPSTSLRLRFARIWHASFDVVSSGLRSHRRVTRGKSGRPESLPCASGTLDRFFKSFA